MHSTAKAINTIIDEGRLVHFERDKVLRTLWVNLLARKHPFLLGPPGTNKTRIISWVCEAITGANFWEVLCNNQLGLEDFFGPIDMIGYKQHNLWQRAVEGYMPTAHVVLLDETFKAGGSVLNPLLDILVRFKFKINGHVIDVPGLMYAMAANELPQGQELGAFWDRRGSAVVLDYIQGEDDFDKLLQLAAGDIANIATQKATRTTITLDEANEAVFTLVPAVQVPSGIREALRQLKSTFLHPPQDTNGQPDGPRIIVSDRRWFQAVELLKASAFLAGRDVVDEDDLQVLADFFWETPETRDVVAKRVMTLASPQTTLALEVDEAIDKALTRISTSQGKSKGELGSIGAEINNDIRKMYFDLVQAKDDAQKAQRSTAKIDEVWDHLTTLREAVLIECIGLPVESARISARAPINPTK